MAKLKQKKDKHLTVRVNADTLEALRRHGVDVPDAIRGLLARLHRDVSKH
jgi:hypothetical protein